MTDTERTHHIDGRQFTTCDLTAYWPGGDGYGWVWSEGLKVIAEGDGYASHEAALEAGTKYAAEESARQAEEAEQEVEDRRYGSHEQQVRRYWESTRF